MKIALIIVAAAVAMWIAFIFVGKIFFWLGLFGLGLIVFLVLKSKFGSYLTKKKDLPKLK